MDNNVQSPRHFHAVTGSFGFTGKYITEKLLSNGYRVKTLTDSYARDNPFGNKIQVYPFHFDTPDRLTRSLQNVSVLYNTYWVRFNSRWFTFADALKNTYTLFDSAKRAGVERVVHISITNPCEDCNLEYFLGKARAENALKRPGLSHAILRPAVLFGKEEIEKVPIRVIDLTKRNQSGPILNDV